METDTRPKEAGPERDIALEELSAALAQTSDPELVKQFLLSILTEYEAGEIATRWALVRLIDRGMSQRSIARSLGLSLCKITRGSRELKKRDSAFRRMVETYKEVSPESLHFSA